MAGEKIIDVGKYLGYVVSAVSFALGLVAVSGYLLPERIPSQFRYTFGVVLMLMGIYRFVATRTRVMQLKRDRDA